MPFSSILTILITYFLFPIYSFLLNYEQYKLEPFLEDRLLVANMALDLERDVFTTEKEIFAEALNFDKKENCVDIHNDDNDKKPIIVESVNEQSISNKYSDDKRHLNKKITPILKHSVSLLPSPWCDLLGPLAYLRPLNFDTNGNTTVAEIKLPSTDSEFTVHNENNTHAQIQSSTDSSSNNVILINSISESNTVNLANNLLVEKHNDYDEDVNDESSDEAEADRLLGLGGGGCSSNSSGIPALIINRSKLLDNNSTNGLLDNNNHHQSTGGIRNHSECDGGGGDSDDGEFDEAYAFWQELMHDRSINIEDMNAGLIENNFDNESNLLVIIFVYFIHIFRLFKFLFFRTQPIFVDVNNFQDICMLEVVNDV